MLEKCNGFFLFQVCNTNNSSIFRCLGIKNQKEDSSEINLFSPVGKDEEENSKKIEKNIGETNNIINKK